MAKSDYSMELHFTDVYRQYQNSDISTREAMCLRAQFPAILTPIADSDLVAGRVKYGDVGFSPQFGGFGFFCNERAILESVEKCAFSPAERERVMDMLLFWRKETTTRKIEAEFTDEMNRALCREKIAEFPFLFEPEIATPLYRMAGVYIDYDKLLRLGMPGLREEAERRRKAAAATGGNAALFEGILSALDLSADVCAHYRAQALKLAEEAEPARKSELEQMAAALGKVAVARPETMREALQLAWLYSTLCGSLEFGRMDAYLGDFYANDLASGRITEAEALELLKSVWRLIGGLIVDVDGRVIVGGRGRHNEKNADAVALLAIEASRQVRQVIPQLTLRFYDGMNPALMERALEALGGGCTFPLLYNDDVNIPAVQHAFNVPREEAEQYVPLGCGEYVLYHRSYGTPSGSINLLKVLEVTLHNGVDPVTGFATGLETGRFEDMESFEELFEAYKKQARHFIEILADHEALEYRVMGREADFLFMSMLYDDCMARGRGMFSGGVRYLGGTLETYGNVNTADSLTAIKETVFDRKQLTQRQLLEALDANFRGHEQQRGLLAACPKYGNDNEDADGMAVAVHEFVCNAIRSQAGRTGLHSYLAVIINNGMNTTLGRWVGASADGRAAGMAMANANTPASGNDKKGITALINSIVKPTPALHAGAVQNLRFSRDMFLNNRSEFDAVLAVYFKKGGSQTMVTVLNKADMERAMKEPEKYKDLFVRVGGFSARFVDLPKDVQNEVFSRVTY